MINLNHLRYFYACALHGNMTNAAKSLEVTQPSLSQQIKIFEHDIGFELFFRNGRKLELTPKGKELFSRSQPIFKSIVNVVDFVEQKNTSTDTVSVAVSDEIERPFISQLVSSLIKQDRFKETKFSVVSKSAENVLQEFNSDNHDLLISHVPFKKIKPFIQFEFPVKLVTSKKQADFSHIQQNNLKYLINGLGQKLVLPSSGIKLRQEINHALKAQNINCEVIFESNILACITESIKQEIGCGFIPTPYILDDFKKNKLLVLGPSGGFWKHKLYLYSRDKNEVDLAQSFTDAIRRFII